MKRKQPLEFEEYKRIFSKVPRLAVDLLISTDEGYLLTLRKKNGYVNQWHLPGGMVFFKERLKDAVERIALEELGVGVEVEKQLGYIEYFSEEKEKGYGYTVTVVFLCRMKAGVRVELDDQAEKYGFFKILPENTVVEQKEFISKL